MRFVTTHGGPAESNDFGTFLWRHVSTHTPIQRHKDEENSDPLMAILVSVAPPGGIATIARQRLHVFFQFYEDQGEVAVERRVLAEGEAELRLNALITAQEGERCTVAGGAQITDSDGHAMGSIMMFIEAAWVPAPLGVRQVLGPPSSVPNAHTDSSSVHSSPTRVTSPSRQRSSSPCRTLPSVVASAATGERTSPTGNQLGSGGSHSSRRSAERQKARLLRSSTQASMCDPSCVAPPPLRTCQRSPPRNRSGLTTGHDSHTASRPGAYGSRSQSARRRHGRECAQSYVGGNAPENITLAGGW